MAEVTAAAATLNVGIGNQRWLLCPTREHLLLSILGDIQVVATLRACRASEAEIATALRSHLDAPVPRPKLGWLSALRPDRPSRIDPGVERVVTRCLINAHRADRTVVTSGQVLLSLLSETDCVAAEILGAHGVTRYGVRNYLGHRLPKDHVPEPPPRPSGPWQLYDVVLHNDDHTPMEFVCRVLETIFDKTPEDAVRLMHLVHRQGCAACGVFTYDGALAKVAAVTDLGREHQFALRCVPVIRTTEREGAHAELLT